MQPQAKVQTKAKIKAKTKAQSESTEYSQDSNYSYEARNNMKFKVIQKSSALQRRFKLKALAQVMASGLVLTSALLLGAPAQAQQLGGSTLVTNVRVPNTEYRESTIDLRVKVLGGEVKIERAWMSGRWYINPHWASLRFRKDVLDESVQSIDRAGAVYTTTGGTELYVLEDVNVYIRKTETGWRWYDREGNWITYNTEGHATGYGDRNNVRVDFELNAKGQITAVKDHHGQTVFTYVYDGGPMPIQITDRAGHAVTYVWDKSKLVTATDVLGYTWGYEYDGSDQLKKRIEPDGGITQIKYAYPVQAITVGAYKGSKAARGLTMTPSNRKEREDPVVPVARITDRTGSTTLLNRDYDRTKREFTVKEEDPQGNTTVSVYNHKGQLMTRTLNGVLRTTIERDGNYQEKTTNARGLVTTTQYNDRQQPVKVVRPDGSTVSYTYESTYGNPTSYTDALGNQGKYVYDAAGNLTQAAQGAGTAEQRNVNLSYDNSYGLPTSMTISAGSESANAITLQQVYDADGNLTTLTDARGNAYHFTHNALGQMLTTQNPLGEIWAYTYNAAGHPVSMSNPLGHTTHYSTDAFGRVTQKTDALGNKSNYSYVYETTGASVGLVIRQSNALNQTTTYRYNNVGQLISTTSPSGNTQTTAYDKLGRAIQRTDAAGNSTQLEYGALGSALDGMIVSAVYPTYKETYKYNTMGMPTQVTQILDGQNGQGGQGTQDAQNQLTTRTGYDANGQAVAVTDAAGRAMQMAYDALGYVVGQTDAMGGQTQQTFDVLGNVTSVTDAKGNMHRFEYNANGSRVKEITPTGEVTQFTYNAANQLTQKTDAVGNTSTYKYDAAGRVVKTTYTAVGESTPEQTVAYTYNAADQLTEVVQKNAQGNIQTRHVYTLDALGRIKSEDMTYGSGAGAFTKTLSYAYDADGNRNAITYPDGKTQTYTYEHEQLKTVQLPNGQSMTWDGYQWQRPGQISTPGSVQTLSYDALQRTKGIETKSIQGANTATVMSRAYTYDKAGNIIERQTEEGTYSYGYDLLDRVTQVNPPQSTLPVEAFAYDAVHNRIGSAQQPGDWQYNVNNQLMQFGEGTEQTVYTYTANGHVATEKAPQAQGGETKTYTYDATDRLIRITSGNDEVARYAYDPFGRRISKTVNGVTTYYLYTDEGLIAELDSAGNIQVAYGWQADTMFGTSPLWQAQVGNSNLQTAEYHYLITDHLGTPQMAVNQNGETTWKATSEVFGKTTPNAANQITMNLRFPGQYYDAETNTHYNYFRDYNPAVGRYVQSDPIGLEGGINLYGYVGGNPLYWADPFGLNGWSTIPMLNGNLPGNRAEFGRAQNRYSENINSQRGIITPQRGMNRKVTLCQALRLMRDNPNIYTDGSDLYTKSIGLEDAVGYDLGINMLTSDGVDLQYFLISHSATSSTNIIGGALAATFMDIFSIIGGAGSAVNANLEGKKWGITDYYNELQTDTRGTAIGFIAGNMGIDSYIERFCNDKCN